MCAILQGWETVLVSWIANERRPSQQTVTRKTANIKMQRPASQSFRALFHDTDFRNWNHYVNRQSLLHADDNHNIGLIDKCFTMTILPMITVVNFYDWIRLSLFHNVSKWFISLRAHSQQNMLNLRRRLERSYTLRRRSSTHIERRGSQRTWRAVPMADTPPLSISVEI